MSTQKYIKIGGQVPIVLKEIACTLKDKTATEATLQEIEGSLNSILSTIQSEQDYEAKLVVDDNGNGQTYLEVRRWNSDTQTWEAPEYYLPGSNTPSTPILPLVYINPNTFLAQIVSNTTGLATETTLSSVDTTTTNAYTELLNQGLTLDDIETALNTLNSIAATEITLQSLLTELISVNLNIGNLSEEATQLLVLAALNSIISNTTGLATETTLNAVDTKLSSVVVTPSLIRATGAGTISAGAYSFSVANVGLLNGILLGVSIKPGEIISFDAGSLNNTYGAVSYDGTGTELLITVNS